MQRQGMLIRGLAGHSHYHNIRHRKAKMDAKRQSAFQKLSRDIYAAIKAGGSSDAMANARLARAVEMARRGSLPKERIERALQSGARRMSEGTAVFEGVFPGGIGVVVRASDGRRNAVAGEMRALFSRAGGEIGRAGWLFTEKHVVVVPHVGEEVALCGMEEGAEDVDMSDEGVEMICSNAAERERVKRVVVEKFGIEGAYGEKRMEARGMVAVEGERSEKLRRLFEALDGHDDVFEVIHNAEVGEGGEV